MNLNEFWFLLIAVLWIGYFVLEGFDFGVGILLRPVGRTEKGKRVLINTIGPVWDGNEVWVITAAGAMFAAFPHWYATLFSGAYLPLLAILVCLIVRGLAFEYRAKGDTDKWRRNWDTAISVCSFLPPLLWGATLGSIVHGVPLRADHEFTGGLTDFFTPFAVLAAGVTFALFTTHGAVFLALKTTGEIRDRARRIAVPGGIVAAIGLAGFVLWMQQVRGGVAGQQLGALSVVIGLTGAAAVLAAVLLTRIGRDGWAFTASAAGVLSLVASMFAALFPLVMPSTADPAGTLDVMNAASSPYTLQVMSWVAIGLVPFVLAYQAWTYWVFRKRLSTRQIPDPAPAPAPAPAPEPAAASEPDAEPAGTGAGS